MTEVHCTAHVDYDPESRLIPAGLEVERLDEDSYSEEYHHYAKGWNECMDKHVTRLQAEAAGYKDLVERTARQNKVWLAERNQFMVERDALKAEVERMKTACTKEFESVEHLNNELTKARVWERFAGYLLDNCEGQEIYEERLQYWLSEMLAKEAHQSAPAAKD